MSIELVELTEAEREIRELSRDFAKREVRPLAAHVDEADHEMQWDLWGKATETGLTTFMIPEEFGGEGLTDTFTSALVYEELCWGDVGLGQLITSNGFHTLPVQTLGSRAQQERWMPRVVGSNAKPTAIAITEPGAGSDSAAMRSLAKPVDGGYRLNGQKAWISNGEVADFTVVFATVDPSLKSRGITAFVLEPGDEGYGIGNPMKKMGQRGMLCNELFFDDVFLPEDRRLGDEGAGFRGLMKAFEKSRTLVAAGSVGLARAAYEYTLEYTKARETFGKRVIDHQAIGFRLADMATRIEAARMMVWKAAKVIDAGESAAVASSMAKVFASETAMFCAWGAVQSLGGWGYSREYPVERWMRDAKLDEIGEGTSEILRMIISRSIGKE